MLKHEDFATAWDNFDKRIEQKIFHTVIIVDNEKAASETKAYQKVPEIPSFTTGYREDKFNHATKNNY